MAGRTRAAQRLRISSSSGHRNFDDDAPELPLDGPVFELGGETFHCMPCPPAGVLPRLMAAGRVDEHGRQQSNTPDLIMFIEDVLADELPVEVKPSAEGEEPSVAFEPCDDIERWRALVKDRRRPVHATVILKIVLWLAEEYAERPTEPSSR